jgi:hypothetical protein
MQKKIAISLNGKIKDITKISNINHWMDKTGYIFVYENEDLIIFCDPASNWKYIYKLIIKLSGKTNIGNVTCQMLNMALLP